MDDIVDDAFALFRNVVALSAAAIHQLGVDWLRSQALRDYEGNQGNHHQAQQGTKISRHLRNQHHPRYRRMDDGRKIPRHGQHHEGGNVFSVNAQQVFQQPGVDSAGDGAQHQQGQEDSARCGGSEAGSGEYEFHCQKHQQRFQRKVALCNPAHQSVSASQSNRVCKEADVGHGQAHRQLGKRRNISLVIHFSGLWVQPPSSRPLLGQRVGRRAYPVKKILHPVDGPVIQASEQAQHHPQNHGEPVIFQRKTVLNPEAEYRLHSYDVGGHKIR